MVMGNGVRPPLRIALLPPLRTLHRLLRLSESFACAGILIREGARMLISCTHLVHAPSLPFIRPWPVYQTVLTMLYQCHLR